MGFSFGSMIYPNQKWIQHFCEQYRLSILKSLGQNFLIDRQMAEKIYKFFHIEANDYIIEVGPGFGAMTFFFLQRSDIILTTVEIDKKIAAYWDDLYKKASLVDRWTPIHHDILTYDWNQFFSDQYEAKLLSNLPYAITGPFLMKLFKYRNHFSHCILLLQKDVVQKMIAPVGSKDYSRLSVYFHLWASVKKLTDVSSRCFYPVPQVNSSLVSIKFHQKETQDDDLYINLVSTLFQQKRKMISNTLKNFIYQGQFLTYNERKDLLLSSKIEPKKRPQELSPQDFVFLVKNLKKIVNK